MSSPRISANRTARTSFVVLFVVALVLLILLVVPLWQPLVLAAVLVAVMGPLNRRLIGWFGGRRKLAWASTGSWCSSR
jgi:predicted PurR-regulated permease PerM